MKNKSTFLPLTAIFCGLTATAFAINLPPDISLTGGTDANNYTVTAVNAGVNGWGSFTGTFDAANQFLISPNTTSGTLTFDGAISGVSGIQVQPTGANPVIFNGANSFDGNLNLAGAWLRIGNATALGSTAGVTSFKNWNGPASYLDLNGQTVTGETLFHGYWDGVVNSQLLNSSASTATWTGNVTLGTQTRFSAAGAGNLVISGNIADDVAGATIQVDASGGGQVVLSGNNTNTGWIVDANSRLVAGSAQAFGTTANPTVIPGWATWGLVDVNGQTIAGETFQNDLTNGVLANMAATSGSWGGPVVGNAQLRFLAGSTGDLNITGAISGTSIQVDSGGGGAVVLSGNNTFTDSLNISAATVRLGSANALGTTAGITRIVNWDAAYTALDVNGQTITGETFENNRLNAQLLNTGGNATWAGNVVANEQTRLTAGAGSLTVSGVVSGTHLQVDGGAVILSGNNTYTGATTIANSRVFIGHANALGTTAGQTYIAGWGAWGAVDLNGFTVTGETLTFDQGGNLENSAAGAAAWNGNVNNNTWMVVRPTGGTLTVGGNITGAGGIGKNEASTAIFSGTNTYLGATNIDQGTLEIASGGSITSPTNIAIASAGTLKFSGGAVTLDGGVGYILNSGTMDVNGQTIAAGSYEASPFWAANAKLTNSSASAAVIDGTANKNTVWFNASGATIETVGNLTIDSIVTDGGSGNGFTKTGVGTLFLTNPGNDYDGNTIINGGALTLSSSGYLRFNIGANGINNKVLGTASVNLNGSFEFDLSTAGTTTGNSWTIVDVATLNESYGGTFAVSSTLGPFTNSSGTWTRSENGVTYRYVQSTGVLSVISAGANYASWASAFSSPALSNTASTADPDNDGLINAVEYALGFDPRFSSGSPGVASNGGKTITFTKGAEAKVNGDVTYDIETSTTLGAAPSPWTLGIAPDVTENADTITITFPPGPVKNFARLKVILTP